MCNISRRPPRDSENVNDEQQRYNIYEIGENAYIGAYCGNRSFSNTVKSEFDAMYSVSEHVNE